MLSLRAIPLLVISAFFCVEAHSTKYNALLMTGGFASWERFKDTTFEVTSNDRAALSQRFKLNVSEFYLDGLGWSVDLRDKYDFFEKLNRELMELKGNNTFQVQQLSVHYLFPGKKLASTLGRFPIRSQGGEFLDGVEVKGKLFSALSLGAFGGLNPKRPDQTYVEFNRDSYQVGVFSETLMNLETPGTHLYLINGLHLQREGTKASRTFLFQDWEYQWSENSRLRALLFLDFVPTVIVQNGYVALSNGWTPSLSSTFQYQIVDTIRYLRVADVLEQLPASQYQEGKVLFRHRTSDSIHFSAWGLYGKRQMDNLDKWEVGVGTFHPKFTSNSLTLETGFGYRRPFGGEDLFGRGRLQYISRNMELGMFQELALEKRSGIQNSVPTVTDLSGTYYFPDSLFLSLAFQYARNSLVNVYTGYLQAGYRFGNSTLASRREQAPTRSVW